PGGGGAVRHRGVLLRGDRRDHGREARHRAQPHPPRPGAAAGRPRAPGTAGAGAMSHLGTQISALIDGELAGAELDRANAHLAGCAACQTEAAQLRQLKRDLSALGELDSSDAVTRRLLAMTYQNGAVSARPLSRRPGRRARRRRGRYVMWSAMSIVVVGVGAAAFGMGGGSSSGGNEPQITPQL